MKPDIAPENDDGLARVMRQWMVEAPLPPRFQEQVWSRIQRSEVRPQPALRAWWSGLVSVVVPRPRFAVGYLTAFLALGVAAGAITAQRKASLLDSQLGLRYVQSIDPYLTEAPPQ